MRARARLTSSNFAELEEKQSMQPMLAEAAKNMTDYMNVSPTPLTRRAMRLSRSPGRREATRSRFAEPVNAEPDHVGAEASSPATRAGR